MLDTLGGFTVRHRKSILVVTGVWFALTVLVLSSGVGRLSTGSIQGLESSRAGELVDGILQRAPDTTFIAIFTSPSLDPEGDPFREAMDGALEPLSHDPAIGSITTPANAGPLRGPAMVDDAAHAAYALISVAGEFREAAHAYPRLRREIRSDVLSVQCTGRLPFVHDLDETLEHDLLRAEAISLPVCILLLCVVFGTVVAAILPVCVGGLAVASGLAVVVVLSRFVDLAQYTLNVCSLIGLGVAIDYSLFIVSRYREELAAGHDYTAALRLAVVRAGRVVLFSGFAVTIGLAGLLFFSRSYLMAMGVGGAIVVGFAVLFALTFLPSLLAVLGPWIHAGRVPFARQGSADTSGWHRTAVWVMKRPIAVLVPSLVVLAVMGAPFRHLRMAASDVRVLPEDTEARRAYELVRTAFPEIAANHVLAAVEFPSSPALNRTRIEALYDFTHRVTGLPYVTRVQSIVDPNQPIARDGWADLLLTPPPAFAALVEEGKRLSVGRRAVLVDITTDQTPESEPARAIVRALRTERHVADGTVFVGGQTATDVDTTDYIIDGSPRVVGFVVVVTYVVLFFLLGSVLLPLKAVLMNFLSIAGSFGALVWIFQEGHAFVHTARPVEPSLPVLLFCMLFGLSMDYEVLMLTRMKEAYDQTGDNRAAVATGLEKSAGLITSAAAIMVSVFAAFALAQIVLIQAVGFGMALAVTLDATVVRVLVVPATMRLLGHLNWWAPAPLSRLVRAVGLNETH
jgi:RND superfamily putative drug exporter